MISQLRHLPIGTQFRLDLGGGSGRDGELVYLNDCRALVRLTSTPRQVAFVDAAGQERVFEASSSGLQSWSPSTEVEVAP